MKNIFAAFLILFSFIGYSQSVFRPAVVTVQKECSEPDIIGYNTFINKFSSPDLRFVRIQKTLSSQWTSAYCDCELCHDIYTDTADFYINIGDSCKTSAHFYPANTKGNGNVKIKIFDPDYPEVFVIGEYIATCSVASFVFLDKEQLKVYPNPATTSLNILFGSAEPYQINIIAADGKIILNQKADGLRHDFDISTLNPGLYSVKVESSGKVFFAKFIKL